ncbi:MAG: WD40/YVTN/BNR-like repeat-containing protein, partial [Terriglobales bacterium]
GRQAPPGQPAAWYLQRARRQLERIPVLRPRGSPPAATLAHGAVRLLGAPQPEFGGQWTALGPAPETTSYWGDVAGRVTALALDPADSTGNTLYMAAAYGGLWKSTNAMGASPSFIPIGDNLPTLAVGSIAIDDALSSPAIFVGSGEPNNSGDSYYGAGIFASTDGGQTWTQSTQADGGAETFLGLAFGTILVAPGNGQTLLACAASANDIVVSGTDEVPGVYQSTDGGATWSLVLSAPSSLPYGFVARGESCTALLYAPALKEYVAALSGSGFFVSPTGAAGSWQPLPSPFPSGTAANPYNFFRASLTVRAGVWYSLIADGDSTLSAAGTGDTGLAMSANGGQTWQAIAAPPELFCAAQGSIPCQGVYDLYVAAPPGGAGLVVAGIDVWTTASLSGAKTAWTNLTQSYTNGVVHPDQHAIAFLDGQHWFIGNDGGVWRTADSGADWTDLNASLNTIQFMSVSAVGGGVYLGGSQDNGTALSAAGGTGWNLIWGGDGGDTAVSPSNAQELLTENFGVSLQHSQDGGKTFSPVVTGATITGPSDFYVPYELDPSNPSQVLLGASGVWQGPADPTGSGVGWAEVGTLNTSSFCQLVPKDVITALAAAPSSPDVIYAGFADGQLYVNDNATASPTWSSIDGPSFAHCSPPLPIGALAVSPADPNTVYTGIQGLGLENSDLGHVYKSTDGGKTLTDITGNLPDVPVNSIIV